MVHQTVTVTVGSTMDPDGVAGSVAACGFYGTMRIGVQGLLPGCGWGPEVTLDARFTVQYLGDYMASNPLCIVQSKFSLSNFELTGLDQVDGALRPYIESKARDEVLEALDDEVATQMNWYKNATGASSPPALATGRCSDWRLLSP